MKKSLLVHIIFLIIDIAILVLVLFVSSFNEEVNNLPPYVLPDEDIQEFDLNGYKEFSLVKERKYIYDEYSAVISSTVKSVYTVTKAEVKIWDIIEADSVVGYYYENKVFNSSSGRVVLIEAPNVDGEIKVTILNADSVILTIKMPQANFSRFNPSLRTTAILPNGEEILMASIPKEYKVVSGTIEIQFKPIELSFNVIEGMTNIRIRVNQNLYNGTDIFIPYESFFYNNKNNYSINQYFSFIRKQFDPTTLSFKYTAINIKAGIRIGDYVAVLNVEEIDFTILVKVA